MDSFNIKYNTPLVPKEYIEDFCSTIGKIKRSPIVLYGLFVELLKQIYREFPELEDGVNPLEPVNTNITWNQDQSKSKILIDTEYNWNNEIPEIKPAIYVSIPQIQYIKFSPNNVVSEDLKDAVNHMGCQVNGVVSFIHIGASKGETVTLTGITAEYLVGLANVIAEDFCFKSFNVISTMPVVPVKMEKDFIRGIVTAQFSFDEYWSIKHESPKLKTVIFNTRQEIINLL